MFASVQKENISKLLKIVLKIEFDYDSNRKTLEL